MEEGGYHNKSNECILIPSKPLETDNILKFTSKDTQEGQLDSTSNTNSASTSSRSIDLLFKEEKKTLSKNSLNILNINNNNIIITTNINNEKKKIDIFSDKAKIVYDSSSINVFSLIKISNHPFILILSILFEISSVLLFIIEDNLSFNKFNFSQSFLSFLIAIINTINFWFTKNISGRLLLGLHWWNEMKTNSQEKWIFGKQNDFRIINYENTFFWTVLYSSTTIWGVILLIKIEEMNWIMIIACLISFLLSFFNAFGYNRCANEQSKKNFDTNV